MMGHRDACCPDLCRRPVSEIGEFFRQLQRFECGRNAGAEQNQEGPFGKGVEGLDGMSALSIIAVARRESARRCPDGAVPAAEGATQASGKSDLESISIHCGVNGSNGESP